MSEKIRIRMAEEKDWEVLLSHNRAMALETEDKELPLAVAAAGVKAVFRKPEYGFYVVAEKEGTLAGSAMVTSEWSDWRNGVFWWIQSVYVKPEFRNQGIYRGLYEFIKNMAKKNPEVCGFRLYVEKGNHRAQKAYRALGMEETVYRMYEEAKEDVRK